MYPLSTWRYQGTRSRFESLLDAGLHYEALVASAQVTEQVIKRCLRSTLSQRQASVDRDKTKKLRLVPASSLEEVDASLRRYAQGPSGMAKVWQLAIATKGHPSLEALLHEVCGPRTWHFLVTPKPIDAVDLEELYPRGARRRGTSGQVRMGLFPARHTIVHGWNGLSVQTVVPLAVFGCGVALRLLDTASWAGSGIRDPLKPCFRFRRSH